MSIRSRAFWLPVLSLLLAACAAQQSVPSADISAFHHDLGEGPYPWSGQAFDSGPEKFTFALFSDLTGGEREGIYEIAVEQLKLLRPELILSVGDLIEGGTTDREQLGREWDSFDQRTSKARAPVFYAGGNHDLTNPVMWDVFEERYGQLYYYFVYKNTLFLVLNSEDNKPAQQWELKKIRDEAMQAIASEGWGVFPETDYGRSELRKSGRVGQEQAAYFVDVIKRNPGVLHTFVIIHKPVWNRDGEENFAAVEAALSGLPYTVFYGHEHNYQHQVRHGRDYICLGTTGGVQNIKKDMAIDHVTMVTVTEGAVDIANLRMSGIFGKDGKIPLNGEEKCFDARECGEP